MDVSSLYTVIPHEQGIIACREALETRSDKSVPTEFLIDLLELALTKNYFRFENSFYLQISGTAMGSALAPSYANLFMLRYEQNYIMRGAADKLIAYLRYIDDLLLIWDGDAASLTGFFNMLNSMDTPIRFTLKYDTKSIEFLDLLIFKTEDGLGTSLYRKPTDRNTILHAASDHPPSTIRAIPYSQFLRTIRNNSDPEKAQQQLTETFERFLERGYKKELLTQQLQRAIQFTQTDLITRKTKDKPITERMIFTSKYSHVSKHLRTSIQKNWPIVAMDNGLSLFEAPPPIFGHGRNHNLKDLLVKTDFSDKSKTSSNWLSQQQKLGCYRCPDCTTCRSLLIGKDFPHPHTGKRFKIQHRLSCTTPFVVYIVTCPCGLYYVGKASTPLRDRIANHRSAISKAIKENSAKQPVARHFLQMGHGLPTFRCMAIDHQPPLTRGGNRDLALLRREAGWIQRLDTVTPRGLNETLPLGCFL
ncbi:uncharacterized protein nr6a1.L isoform X6 [Xenopus laevis]|uniref:Uncharacterized protein nr6a1.L isoform X6 n=1 Tax=Xenopus laevis TaxID=8355 RepID=A0A8J1LIC7_XENLA|nr:uncharacterized protein nr6a1.L isoform X6 [Xenopus laevis]XP_041428431.1 uncharacterized protein nr6a1.L isoform X6 [Xenopus laevis]